MGESGMAHDFVPGSGGVASQLEAFVVPALRKKREGRGTHCVADGRQSLGHPPDLQSQFFISQIFRFAHVPTPKQ
jgi:hypothetical protein